MNRTEFTGKRTGLCCLAAAAMTAGVLWGTAMTSFAAGSVDMHTEYPGTSAKAGESISFDISLDNGGQAADAALSIVSLPEGWEGYISGGGKRITEVHVPTGTDTASAMLQLTIPADTQDGTYQVLLQSKVGGSVTDTLPITLEVNELTVSQGDFSSEYPEQEGASGTTFTYNATLINNSSEAQTYSLSSGAPAGWQVSFKPSGESTQVASIELEPGASQGLTVTVVPPNNVTAGDYSIPCSAVSGSETLDMDLSLTITGTYDLSLSTPDGSLSFNTHANEESDVTLSITNNSNVELKNINLTASAPTDWSVSFDTPTIDVIEAGATVEATAHVIPSKDAITGDYVVTMKADTEEVSASADFRVAVETSMVWGVVAVAVIAALLYGIYYMFRKYGRR